jgi:DNA-binding NarL/FixJ family response regulator
MSRNVMSSSSTLASPASGWPHAEGFSDRERQVLGLIAQGRSNKEIAWELQLSEDTVKWHAKALFNKLGARNRTDAAISALRRGLVPLH